jgi:uncharacterized protein (TIGR02594 family)
VGPTWLDEALKDEGLAEIPGARTEPRIERMLVRLGAWWRDDETPWCGTAVAAWMDRAGAGKLPRHWYRAKGWLDWGVPIAGPCVGAVVVFAREGGGHVGLVVGRSEDGRLLVLGGNQGNAVRVSPFDPKRAIGYRLPDTPEGLAVASNAAGALPVYASAEATSRNEA